jgi:hypothetical protein
VIDRSDRVASALRVLCSHAICCLPLLLDGAAAEAQPVAVGDEFVVGEATSSYQAVERTRSVSRATDGSFVVVWQKGVLSGRSGIFVQRYDAGGNPLGTEFRVSGEEEAMRNLDSDAPAVAHTQSGEFVVVWRGTPSSDPYAAFPQIVGRQVDSDGALIGTEFGVSIATPTLSGTPDVASMDDGTFVVVWPGRPNPSQYNGQICGQRMTATGSKIGGEFVANTFTSGDNEDPQVGTRGDGSFVIVWTADGYGAVPGPDGAYAGIFGQRFATNGARVGTEFQVNAFTTYPEVEPDIAVRGDGGFVVVWRTVYGDDETFDDSITMRRYDPLGQPLGDETHIDAYVTGFQRSPTIAMENDGSFVVVWTSGNGYYPPFDQRDDGHGLFGRCFTAAGVPGAGEFHVNSYTTGVEREPSISTTGSGEFVVVWERVEDAYIYGGGDLDGRLFTINGCSTTGGTTTTTLPPGEPMLELTKDDGGHGWGNDPTIPYDITVGAQGSAITDVVLTETVPEKTTFNAAASDAGWTCAPDGNAGSTCTFAVGTLNDGQNAVVTFAVDVDEATDPAWDVYNEVEASGTVAAAQITRGGVPLIKFFTDHVTTAEGQQQCDSDPEGCFASCIWCYVVYLATGNPQICPGFDFSLLNSLQAGVPIHRPALTTGSVTSALYTLRDRVLNQTRGGRRAIDLYYEHSPAMIAAAIASASVRTLALDAVQAFDQNVRSLVAGAGSTAIVTQGQLDAMNTFLDALRAQATGALAAAIDRERSRLALDDLVGATMDDLLARLNRLTCQGFEDALFCGEVTGDCVITATDALAVLRIAVGTDQPRPESDVDGSGSTTATDALFALRIAVGVAQQTNACNVI